MKVILISAGAVIAVVLVVLLGHWLFNSPSIPKSPVSFPTGTSSQTGVSSHTSQTMAVQTKDGQVITINNFISNGTTVPDPSNPGNYFLTGSVQGEFIILYNAANQFFTVTLGQEPIGQTRLKAEAFLEKTLGLSSQQLCTLRHAVSTTNDVNSTYAGQSLEFSFCAGAVPLPN